MNSKRVDEIIELAKFLLNEEYAPTPTNFTPQSNQNDSSDDEDMDDFDNDMNTESDFDDTALREILKNNGLSDEQIDDVVSKYAEGQNLNESAHHSTNKFYVAMSKGDYEWSAEYELQSDGQLDYGHWVPVGTITMGEPHPDFWKHKVVGKHTPQEAVKILSDFFDFVGEPLTSEEEIYAQEMGDCDPIKESLDDFSALVRDLESIVIMESFDSDEEASDALWSFIVTDGQIYVNYTTRLIDNLKAKIDRNVYDEEKAHKEWLRLADVGAKKYFKEIGVDEDAESSWNSMFSLESRKETARSLADYYAEHLHGVPEPEDEVSRISSVPDMTSYPEINERVDDFRTIMRDLENLDLGDKE